MTQYSSDWAAFLFHTTSGSVGPAINIQEGGTFSIPLSGNPTANFALDKTDLPDVDLSYWLSFWGPSVVFTFQGRAIYSGPLISSPREYAKEIQFDSAGPRAILSNRYVVSESSLYSSNIAKGVVKYTGKSLGTIAQDVVKLATSKPKGNLPIEYVSPRESVVNDADHQRTYKAYNINTLNVDEVLTKISEVSRGPDIAFRPRMVNASQMVWDMCHGTENNPRIAQKIIPQWDLTAAQSDSASLEITTTGAYLADRVVATGGGTNEATVMAMSENLGRVSKQYPLLEHAYSVSDTLNKSVLTNHAKATLNQNRKPLKEFTLFVDAYGQYPLGSYWPGDLAIIYTKGYFNIPDGAHKMRILNVSGTYGTSQVRLAMQLDDQWT